MQRLSHILSCFVFLFPCLFLADGCANSRLLPPTTQTPTSQGTTACSGTCTPWISLASWAIGLKPGASFTFSATVYNLSDGAVTWTIKEGPAGGAITDAGVYTAPLVEGVYHVIATSTANSSLSQTAVIAVTTTELTVAGKLSTARWYHTASLLPSGQVFIAGGMNDDYDFADPAELYDPAVGKFQDAGQVSRIEHSATVLANGDVLHNRDEHHPASSP